MHLQFVRVHPSPSGLCVTKRDFRPSARKICLCSHPPGGREASQKKKSVTICHLTSSRRRNRRPPQHKFRTHLTQNIGARAAAQCGATRTSQGDRTSAHKENTLSKMCLSKRELKRGRTERQKTKGRGENKCNS